MFESCHGDAVSFQVMTRPVLITIFLVVMIAVVVGVDMLFFRNHFWERLMVNVGIVVVAIAFYLRFLK